MYRIKLELRTELPSLTLIGHLGPRLCEPKSGLPKAINLVGINYQAGHAGCHKITETISFHHHDLKPPELLVSRQF